MALDFPSSPTNGQTYNNFYYDSATGAWRSLGSVYAPNYLKNATFTTATAAGVPLTVQGTTSQSANLQEWKNSSGSTVASIDSSGSLSASSANFSGGVSAQTIVSNRINSIEEGGEIQLMRSSDNAAAWKIDAFGAGSQPDLRIFDNSGAVRLRIKNGAVLMESQPSFLAYSGSGYKAVGWSNIGTFPNSGGTATVVTQHNIGNNYNASTGAFTVPVAGKYLFNFGGWGSYNGAGNRYATSFYVNGVQTWISGSSTTISDSPLVGSSITLNLAANDSVVLWMFSSVSMNLGQGSHNVYWSGTLIG